MDDYRNTPTGPGPLGTMVTWGSGRYGWIDYVGDRDVFAVQLIGGLTYTFDLKEAQADVWDILSDPFLSITGPGVNGPTVSDNNSGEDWPFLNARIEYTASETGIYYATAASFQDQGTGLYEIAVSNGVATTGDDTIRGTASVDGIDGSDGNDVIKGRGGDDVLLGGFGDDFLFGGAGDDSIVGGPGADQMRGGRGNDRYSVDDGDQIFEDSDAGIDLVSASFDYTLQANFENLSLSGDARTGTGNELDNSIFVGFDNVDYVLKGLAGNDTLTGSRGDDALYGGTGADSMFGGEGDDTYYVDDAGDRVAEVQAFESAGGYDRVYTSVSFVLPEDIESLRMIPDSGAINGAGNELDNEIWGSSAVNVLRGLDGDDSFDSNDGADILIGGPGDDVFVYKSTVTSNPAARDKLKAGDGAVAFENPGPKVGDVFDLSALDADTTKAGVQHLVFGTSHAKGHLWAVDAGNKTLIQGNVDGDAAVEFEVAIADGPVTAASYSAEDFLV